MKENPWVAALLNFLLMGLGYVYNGRKVALGACLTVGAVALFYVEASLKNFEPKLYVVMLAALFLVKSALAFDAYLEARELFGADPMPKPKRRKRRVSTPH